MTGLENHRNYEAFGYLAPGQITFGNILQHAGYATGMVGKWQLMGNGFDGRTGITPEQAGFDESYLWQFKALDSKGSRYWGPTRALNGRNKINEEGFGPDLDSDFALDFIDRHKDKPFFLYYSMVLVHNPFVSTPATLDAKGEKDRFSGMVSYMDRLVGRLLDHLRALGLDKNSVVIFTGDNGTNTRITTLRDSIFMHYTIVPGLRPITSGFRSGAARALPRFNESVSSKLGIMRRSGSSTQPASSAMRNGNRRFVVVDAMRGTETEVPAGKLTGEAARRRAQFQKILDEVKDGPLNPEKFPMCTGRPSLDPQISAVVAGCQGMGPGGGD